MVAITQRYGRRTYVTTGVGWATLRGFGALGFLVGVSLLIAAAALAVTLGVIAVLVYLAVQSTRAGLRARARRIEIENDMRARTDAVSWQDYQVLSRRERKLSRAQYVIARRRYAQA